VRGTGAPKDASPPEKTTSFIVFLSNLDWRKIAVKLPAFPMAGEPARLPIAALCRADSVGS
jgi:hypothetical protein